MFSYRTYNCCKHEALRRTKLELEFSLSTRDSGATPKFVLSRPQCPLQLLTNHTPLTPQPVKVLSRNRIRRYTAIAIMTRAQQTVSIGLLVTSLYLSLYLELIPLPSLISEEIIPVVSLANSFTSAIQLGVFQAAGIPVFNIQPLSPS